MANDPQAIIGQTIVLSAPLALAAMGGYTSERSGIINIALEGKMLMSACVTALTTLAFQDPYTGLALGIASSVVLSILHWLLTQVYRIDQIISGMAINLIALGGTNFLLGKFGDQEKTNPALIPLAAFKWLALLLPLGLFLYARYTRGGLRLQAAGSDPDKARLMGVEPLKTRFFALVATGVFTGVAGALLFTNSEHFTDNMTAGRGYIALAALIIGRWRPIPALIACVVFGFFTELQLVLQGVINIPSEAYSAIPYLVTIIALAGFLGRSKAPAGLGRL